MDEVKASTAVVVVERGALAAPASKATLSENPAAIYLARIAVGSRSAQSSALRQLARLLMPSAGEVDPLGVPWGHLRYAHTAALRTQLAEKYAGNTANRMLAALRGVLKEAWRLGQVSAEDYHRAIDFEPVRSTRLPPGRALSEDDMAAIFKVAFAQGPNRGARDAAILAVLYGAGLRRVEIAWLDLESYRSGTGRMRVVGKGNKEREVILPSGARDLVDEWIALRGSAPGPLFTKIHRTDAIQADARLSAEGVTYIIDCLCTAAKVEPFTTHDLRRTFISDALDRVGDLVAVQAMVGHADPKTTARYDRRGDKAKERVVEGIKLPKREGPET